MSIKLTRLSAAIVGALIISAAFHVQAADKEPISPIKPAKVTNPAVVELGKKLFFDPRLSKSGFISCNSCHNLSMGGSDNLSSSIGHNWQRGPINSPTMLDASINVAQFWDGRAKDRKEQAGGPIANPGEMAFTHELAIAAFDETLVTPNSRFDQWLEGKKTALSKDELAGYQQFKGRGCVACHNSVAVGGNSFQKVGVVSAYNESEGSPVGRSAVAGNEVNRFTYPYLHDGAANTLTEAMDIKGRLPLSRKFNDDENAKKVSVHADKQLTRLLRKTPHGTNATASLWTASRACASRKDAASNHPESTAHTGVTGNPEQ